MADITKYAGYAIHLCEDGYFFENEGYFATLEEAKQAIDDRNADEHANEHANDDSDCLDAPWWAYR
jgi:hypothetical protein